MKIPVVLNTSVTNGVVFLHPKGKVLAGGILPIEAFVFDSINVSPVATAGTLYMM